MKLIIDKGYWFLVILILGFSFFIRIHGLLNNPPALFSDEVDAGYQAFIFNHCGNDYYGNKMPSHFQSFADQRTPLYLYSIALTQKLVGYNELAVRLPACLYGLLTTIAFSLLMYKISKNRWTALLALLLISINPWLWHYGRAGWEVTGMLFCLVSGIYCWISYLEKKSLGWLLGAVLFLLGSVYFYATAKLFIVLLGVILLAIWKREIIKIKRQHILLAAFLLLIAGAPMIRDTINGKAGYRFSYITIFTDPTNPDTVKQGRYIDTLTAFKGEEVWGVEPNLESKILHNKISVLTTKFIRNYFAAFSTNYLFLSGDEQQRQGFGGKGNFYYLDFIFLIAGIAAAIYNWKEKINKLMLSYLAAAPVPFSLTRDSISPQSTRLILMVIPMVYFIVLGIIFLLKRINSRLLLIMFSVAALGVYLLSAGDFYHFYTYHYPQLSARAWHAGMKEAVLAATKNANNYKRIYFENTYEPFLPFFYFYTNYLPSSGSCAPAKDTVWDNGPYFDGMTAEHKYYFGQVHWSQFADSALIKEPNLFIIPDSELPSVREALKGKKYQLEISGKIDKRFTNQEGFTLIKLN